MSEINEIIECFDRIRVLLSPAKWPKWRVDMDKPADDVTKRKRLATIAEEGMVRAKKLKEALDILRGI